MMSDPIYLDVCGGTVEWGSIAVNENADTVYFIMNNEPNNVNILTSLQFDDNQNWSKVSQQTWAMPTSDIGRFEQKNYVIMGINQDYIITMSNSLSQTGNDEDCGLYIWNAADLGVPSGMSKISKNTEPSLARNCVHPNLLNDSASNLRLMAVGEPPTEEYPYTDFLYTIIDSNYTIQTDTVGRRINDYAFKFSSVTNPSVSEWYGVGTYDIEMINVLVYYNWNDPSGRAKFYPLEAHGNALHRHSLIITTPGEPDSNGT